MRTLITALFAGLLAVAPLSADEAHDRGRSLLPQRDTIDKTLLTSTLLGCFVQGKMVGWMSYECTETTHGKRPAYRLKQRGVMKIGDSRRMDKQTEALLDTRLRAIRGRGTESGQDGARIIKRILRSYTFEAAGKQLSWRMTEAGKAPVSRQIGGIDLVVNIVMFPRLLLKMERGVRYELHSLDTDKGEVRVSTYQRIGPAERKINRVARATVQFSVGRRQGGRELPRHTLYLDPRTGAILQMTIGGSPLGVSQVTRKQVDAWKAGPKAAVDKGTPVDAVARYFAAIIRHDRKALLGSLDLRRFFLNVSNATDKLEGEAWAAEKARFDAQWNKDSKTITEAFIKDVFSDKIDPDAPKDPESYREFCRQLKASKDQAVVVFEVGGSKLRFLLHKRRGKWLIYDQIDEGK